MESDIAQDVEHVAEAVVHEVLPRDGMVSDTRELDAIARAGARVAEAVDPALAPFITGIEAGLADLRAGAERLDAAVRSLRAHLSSPVTPPTVTRPLSPPAAPLPVAAPEPAPPAATDAAPTPSEPVNATPPQPGEVLNVPVAVPPASQPGVNIAPPSGQVLEPVAPVDPTTPEARDALADAGTDAGIAESQSADPGAPPLS